MTEKNVLYIVEGKSENDLLKRLWDRFKMGADYKVYVYNTNIHVLMDSLFIKDGLDPDIDLIKLLLERELDPSKKENLQKKYTDVYMIFDFEPHDRRFNSDRIMKMLSHYNDSANEGKLFLNYPMVESYRHIMSENDCEFKTRMISVEHISDYKKSVGKESWIKIRDPNKCDADLFKFIIAMHLMKANYLKTGTYQLPEIDDFLSEDGSNILKVQLDAIEDMNSVYVLNTCIFNILDYAPRKMFDLLEPVASKISEKDSIHTA